MSCFMCLKISMHMTRGIRNKLRRELHSGTLFYFLSYRKSYYCVLGKNDMRERATFNSVPQVAHRAKQRRRKERKSEFPTPPVLNQSATTFAFPSVRFFFYAVRKFKWWCNCLALCDENSNYFPLYDELLRHIERCNSVISHTQRNPPNFSKSLGIQAEVAASEL